MKNEFKLKDGRVVNFDFGNVESLLAISLSDWAEINEQLDKAVKAMCSQLSGEEVYEIFVKNKSN